MNRFDKYINENFINSIVKFLDKDIQDKWRAQKNNLLNIENIKISNTGLVSSGKSTLFNVLTNNIDTERFPTGAARTTVSEDIEKLKDNTYIIDTPGIDVRASDDESAYLSILSSDVILIIHNIKLGMLHKNETEWIEKICANFENLEERKDRIIFICSWIDERDSDEDFDETISQIKKMLLDVTKVQLDFYTVSSKRYITGVRKNSEALKRKSNILELRQAISDKSILVREKYGVKSKLKFVNELCDNTIIRLDSIKKDKQKIKNQKEQIIEKTYKSKQSEWKSLHNMLYQKMQNYIELENELKNI